MALPGDDPFDVLGLPARFDLGQAEIARAYLGRADTLHPDVVGDDQATGSRAAAANRAKAILEDPESRANALLARLGGPGKEDDRSLPPDFLMEMMETREAIERAVEAGDAAAISRWESWADERRAGFIAAVGEAFARLGPAPDPADLRAIRTQLNAWRYIERLIEQLE